MGRSFSFPPRLSGRKSGPASGRTEPDCTVPPWPRPGPFRRRRTRLPRVSVLVPVRNGARHIGACLDAVLQQDYPSRLVQVIIADGGSSDGTRVIIEEKIRGVANVQLIHNTCRIVPTAMNLMMQQAKGKVIVRIDGHCEVPPDYLIRCVEHLHREGVDGVGGSITTIGHTPLSRSIALAMSSPFGVGDSAFRTQLERSLLADTIPFPAYTSRIVSLAGLYDEELVRDQDDEYNYRIRELGGKLLLAGDISTKYYSRTSLPRLWRQYFEYGFFKVRVLQKHPKQMRPRQFVPPLFALSVILSLCLTAFLPWGWAGLAAVAGSYALANLAASALTASRKGWQHITFLPVVYAILHVSYGFGFLAGLVRFCHRWGDRVGKVPQLSVASELSAARARSHERPPERYMPWVPRGVSSPDRERGPVLEPF
jgi:succinoglycan biosynthesis protein ExoA